MRSERARGMIDKNYGFPRRKARRPPSRRNKIYYCSREQFIPPVACCQHRHRRRTNNAAARALPLPPRCRQAAAAAALDFIRDGAQFGRNRRPTDSPTQKQRQPSQLMGTHSTPQDNQLIEAALPQGFINEHSNPVRATPS